MYIQSNIPLVFKTRSELYDQIADLMTEDEFESEIRKRDKECGGLLSEDAISYLIVDELGRSDSASAKISDLKNGDNVSLTVSVEELGMIREFTKKDGTSGRVTNITVSDGTGSCRFTLWNKDVDALTDNTINVGSRIKIVNGYVKVSNFGVEISTGRWGMYTVEDER
jgi:replication factor A1